MYMHTFFTYCVYIYIYICIHILLFCLFTIWRKRLTALHNEGCGLAARRRSTAHILSSAESFTYRGTLSNAPCLSHPSPCPAAVHLPPKICSLQLMLSITWALLFQEPCCRELAADGIDLRWCAALPLCFLRSMKWRKKETLSLLLVCT